MSANDFKGLLLAPVMAFPRRPLSKRESTDSCNIRFSFLTIISGAFNSRRRFSLLFRLITLLYKSFKSDVANLPPSKGTNGRRSGGKTGKASNIIHSGFTPDFENPSKTFNLLAIFLIFKSDDVLPNSCLNSKISFSRSIDFSNSLTPSAPILATNSPSPN